MNSESHRPASVDDDLAVLLRRFLHDQIRIIERERGRILESDDHEPVHQMRVALRRTRSVLKSLGLGKSPIQAEAGWVADRLGVVRDLDVLREKTPDSQGRLLEYVDKRRAKKRAALRKCLKSKRYRRLERAFRQLLPVSRPFEISIAEGLRQFLDSAIARVREKGRAINAKSPDQALHRLRIECKRLRYLAEMFRSALPREIDELLATTSDLQELLGEFNDERVALAQIARHAKHLPLTESSRHALIDAGRSLAAHEHRAVALRHAFVDAWASFDQAIADTACSLRHGTKAVSARSPTSEVKRCSM